MVHVAEYKKKTVDEFSRLIESYPVIGAVNMESLPATQLQKMRQQLRGKVLIKMSKRRLMKVAIENVKDKKKGIEKIKESLDGMPAMVFTKDDPFMLAKTLKRSMSAAPAKAGQIAPKDIVVSAGPTPFSPGPVISELASVGIKTGIEGGKIVVKEDAVVVKKGEKVKPETASILARLGIEPMEVGLNMTAVYQDGLIFTREVLDIDEDKFLEDVKSLHKSAFMFALGIAYPTKETIEVLAAKAFRESKAFAIAQNVLADAVINELMAKASNEMMALKSKLNISESGEKEQESKAE